MRSVLVIAAALLSVPAHALELVGTQVPPYPAGLNNLIGSCLGDTQKGEDICAWSVGTLNDSSDVPLGVFAGKSAGNAADGTARWLVTGYLDLPSAEQGYEVQIGSCRRSGVDDETIVAVARIDPNKDYSGDVTWAAQLDRTNGALTLLATTGIDCANIGPD